MRHLAAYLLLTVGGNAKPTVEEVTAVLGQAGIETDSTRLSALFAELEGKDVEELIALGKEKLMKGGAVSSAAPAAAAGAGAAAEAAPAAAAAPVEEEADALDGGMDMFGGGGAKTGDY
mmetsp:Transcript_470/g.527  ORF Transcript_470/g.527 Transcript_470/m.527 type:complete len:119 (+) Transcript_470:72-428(+)|eukprot:CAMPEP_0119050986 /NCGR_PEP_ID=MMETSP1177-20130426/72750_1 /TAXON_ID=2985 /ORGANISM="Ochromonas sp, Strain CCMP1899" /LENGTH=118 /DNA_ID=CAMNT_0007030031 /DNA_START=68 /DNA_END=424 /DNA_ORIENTATION=+